MSLLLALASAGAVGIIVNACGTSEDVAVVDTAATDTQVVDAAADSSMPRGDGAREWCSMPPDYREGGPVPPETPGAFECPEGQLCGFEDKWMCCNPEVANQWTWCHH
jgi:hypothetical protein